MDGSNPCLTLLQAWSTSKHLDWLIRPVEAHLRPLNFILHTAVWHSGFRQASRDGVTLSTGGDAPTSEWRMHNIAYSLSTFHTPSVRRIVTSWLKWISMRQTTEYSTVLATSQCIKTVCGLVFMSRNIIRHNRKNKQSGTKYQMARHQLMKAPWDSKPRIADVQTTADYFRLYDRQRVIRYMWTAIYEVPTVERIYKTPSRRWTIHDDDDDVGNDADDLCGRRSGTLCEFTDKADDRRLHQRRQSRQQNFTRYRCC